MNGSIMGMFRHAGFSVVVLVVCGVMLIIMIARRQAVEKKTGKSHTVPTGSEASATAAAAN